MNESANKKTLGQIAYEAHFAPCSPAVPWRMTSISHMGLWESIGEAVKAAVLARQSQTSPVGELSEEEVLRIAKQAHDEVFPGASFYSLGLTEKAVIKAVRLASRPTAPTVYVTADRPPTEADFVDARVFGWSASVKNWSPRVDLEMLLEDAPDSHWFSIKLPPAPVPPVSAEEAQIELMAEALWMANDHERIPYKDAREYDRNIHRKMAKAALSFSK